METHIDNHACYPDIKHEIRFKYCKVKINKEKDLNATLGSLSQFEWQLENTYGSLDWDHETI